MEATEVFTPGAHPTVTFIDTHIRSSRIILLDALATGSLVVTLSGPSKSGKTVFVEEAVGKGNLIHVTGAGVSTPSVLWTRIFAVIGTPLARSELLGSRTTTGATGSATAGIPLVATGQVTTAIQSERNSGTSESQAIDVQTTLVSELQGTNLVLFIDDFHYIAKDAQSPIAETVKEIARRGVKVVLAAVPYRGDDPLRANADLRGRSVALDLGYWDEATLKQIALRGFPKLNVEVSDEQVTRLAREAAGSPQLMQALCLNACFEASVRRTLDVSSPLSTDSGFFRRVCTRTALMADYRTVVSQMREGPKTRGQPRLTYVTRSGNQGDVYPIVLEALSLDPPKLTTRYNELMQRIAVLFESEGPSGSSVTGACDHMAAIANAAAGSSVVEWDIDHDVFDIRDPYLLFYLRWSVFPDHT